MNTDSRVRLSWNVLRYAYGIVIILVGLDKLFGTDFIVYWPMYISPFVMNLLPVSVPVFLIAMGIIEVAVGAMLLTKLSRIAGYLSIAWLLLIAVNLLLGGYVDIAVRDILLAVGAFVSTELGAVVAESRTHA